MLLQVAVSIIPHYLAPLKNSSGHKPSGLLVSVYSECYIDSDIAWHKVSKETLNTKFHQADRIVCRHGFEQTGTATFSACQHVNVGNILNK
jgi:hypothetical protein